MKGKIKVTVLTAMVVISGLYCSAQQPGPVPPPPPPAGPAMTPPPKVNPLEQLTTLTGTVLTYDANDRFEYDGMDLREKDQNVMVKFPAHLGRQLFSAAPKGSTVTVSGTLDETLEGKVFRLYSLKADGKTITETAPAMPETPPAEELKDFSGTVSAVRRDRNGRVNGIVLNKNLVVMLPPPAVDQLSAYLKDGVTLSGTGIVHGVPEGVVIAGNMKLTDARTLSIDGKTYLIR